MNYDITIESPDGTKIELSKQADQDITDVQFQYVTLDDNVRSKSSAVVTRILIEGNIDPKRNGDQLLKIYDWAKDFNDDTTYRTIKITVYESSEGSKIRSYQVGKVFVTDFTEQFCAKESSDGNRTFDCKTFSLKLNQVQNNLKESKAY